MQRNELLSKVRKGLVYPFIGLLAFGAGFYVGGCVRRSSDINKQLEPLKKEFIQVVSEESDHAMHNYKVEYSDDGRIIIPDYRGRLDKIIKEKNDYLSNVRGIIKPRWRVYDYKYPFTPPAISLIPYGEVPELKQIDK
jgi:hypothetical protein